MTYKDKQEAFVGNLHGTNLRYTDISTCLQCCAAVYNTVPYIHNIDKSYFSTSFLSSDFILCLSLLPTALLLLELAQSLTGRVHILQDLLVLVLPLTLALTVLADHVPLFLTFSLCVVAILFVIKNYVHVVAPFASVPLTTTASAVTSPPSRCNELQNLVPDTPHIKRLHSPRVKLSFITLFRGGNLLMTCLSILAIDFHVYPRRFGKTELFGFSLMDSGAGEHTSTALRGCACA
jgi:hypothetical protein